MGSMRFGYVAFQRLLKTKQRIVCTRHRRRLVGESLERRNLMAAGVLDTSFGIGGKVIQDLAIPGEAITASKKAVTFVQGGETKSIAFGSGQDGAFYLARYHEDGSIDTSFGNNGTQAVTFRGQAADLAVAADGSAVIVGYHSQTQSDGYSSEKMAVAKLTPTGQLDATFGIAGKQTIDFGSSQDRANGVAIDLSGRVIVVGGNDVGGFLVARLLGNGQLDTSFDGDGKVDVPFERGAEAVAIQSDGKIIVSGTVLQDGPAFYDIAVTRLNENGSVDTSFQGAGQAFYSLSANGSYDNNTALAIQADDSIVLAGYSAGFGDDFTVLRLSPNGNIDSTFGANGWKQINFDGSDRPGSVVVTSDGSIYVGSGDKVARLTSVGQLDPTFGSGGKKTIAQYGLEGAVAVQPDGKILMVGGLRNFSITRLNSNGVIDATFGNQGTATAVFSSATSDEYVLNAFATSTGKIWWRARCLIIHQASLWLATTQMVRPI